MKKIWVYCFSLFILIAGSARAYDLMRLKPPADSRSNPPAIAFAPDGSLWIAWGSYREGRFRITVDSYSDGKWMPPVYPDPALTDQVEPQLLVESGKKVILIYSSFDGRTWTINRTARTPKGWEKPRVLGRGFHPSAVSANGRLWVAWERDGEILLMEEEGVREKSAIRSLQSQGGFENYSYPRLGKGPGGEIWLVWTAARRGYQSVLLQRVDEDHPLLVVDEGSGVNRNPRLSVDSAGRVWIVYERLLFHKEGDPRYWEQTGRPVYLLDRIYGVENPSRVLKITDGEKWWTTETPKNPALGLMPSVYCSRKGPVWLLSRNFTGYSSPYDYFSPLCEVLDAGGWKNHGVVWLKVQSYKASMPFAEDPEGRVWTAWAQHDREKKGMQDTPSWTHMDGPDFIVIAPMPELKDYKPPRLFPLERRYSEVPASQTLPRYRCAYKGESLQVYFGDLHQHSEISGCGRQNGRIDQNQYYSRFVRGLDFMCTIDHAEHQNDHTWRMTQLAAQMFDSPGDFVTFTGFEWTSEFDAGGNLYRGHYNVVFRDVGIGDYYFSASDPERNTPLELWEALRETAGGPDNVLTFGHHTSRRMAWLSWNYYDPEMVPLIEIAQARGSYEYEGCFAGLELDNDCTRVRGHYIHDGLERGMRWGFVAGGDHGGRQLVAVFAPRLDRKSIFQSLKNKRTYATSGERIFLDMRINGRFMGEEFVSEEKSRLVEIKATGTAPLTEIDLFRNGRSIRQWVMKRTSADIEWEDDEPLFSRENYYYVRVTQIDGHQAWSSPIWVINPQIPGEFQFQVGGDELRVIYPDQETDFSILMHNETEKDIKGLVVLEVPENWMVKERGGIRVECPAGAWRHAVFHVKAPSSAFPTLRLVSSEACFVYPDARMVKSPLFVVGSPRPLSREQKAVLIDARTEVPPQKFQDYLKKISGIWAKEF